MKFNFRSHFIFVSAAVSLLLILSSWLWAYFSLHQIKEPLVIHFTPLGGISQIGRLGDLSGIAAFGVIVLAVNFWLSINMEKRDLIWGKVIMAATAFTSLLIFTGFAAIIGAN